MSSFSKKSYAQLISLAKSNKYIISNFKQFSRNIKKEQPIILLRHDCDLSLDAAVELAELEKELGISSTYFIQLYNEFYNPLSQSGRKSINYIKSCGHEIGIHWDSRNYTDSNASGFKRDIEHIEEIIKSKVLSGSQHEPVQTRGMIAPLYLKHEAYRDYKDLQYISDSSMKWREITPWDVIPKKISFQFLAHPFWWTMKGKSRKDKFSYFSNISEKNISKKISRYAYETETFLKIRKKLDNEFKFKKNKQK